MSCYALSRTTAKRVKKSVQRELHLSHIDSSNCHVVIVSFEKRYPIMLHIFENCSRIDSEGINSSISISALSFEPNLNQLPMNVLITIVRELKMSRQIF